MKLTKVNGMAEAQGGVAGAGKIQGFFAALRMTTSLVALVAAGVLSGCGAGVTAPTSVAGVTNAGAMSGKIHGGQMPVKYATVNLYAAGETGYGSPATLLATYTTGADGAFYFVKGTGYGTSSGSAGNTWECPSSTDDSQIYIMSTGGNPQLSGGNDTDRNPAITLVALLGPCSQVSASQFVLVDEQSTAAAAYALSAYISPGTLAGSSTIGTMGANTSSPAQAVIGLNNAVLGSRNLRDTVSPTYSGTSGTAANITVTAKSETGKMNQIGNILAACVNSVYSNSNTTPSATCSQLFNAAMPKTGTTLPADIFQAAYNMATNPTDVSSATFVSCGSNYTTNLQCLAALSSATGPFQTAAATVPTDWTVGVTYSATGTCAGSPVATAQFFNVPVRAQVDASGNIWVINGNSSAASVIEMAPNGQPLQCLVPLQDATVGSTYGQDITIDPSGNVWGLYSHTPTIRNAMVEIASGGTSMTYYTPAAQAFNILSDADGNIFYTQSSTGSSLYELVNPLSGGITLSPTLQTTNTQSSTPATVTALSMYAPGATTTYATINLAANTTGTIFAATTGTVNLLGAFPATAAITSYSASGGTATFNATNSFSSLVGQIVTISGLSTSGLNGRFTLTGATGTTFTVAYPSTVTTVTEAGLAHMTGTGAYTGALNSLYSTSQGLGIGSYTGANANYAGQTFLYTGTQCCGSTAGRSIATRVSATSAGFTSGAYTSTGSTTSANQNQGGLTGTRSVAVDGAGAVWLGEYYGATSNTSNVPVFGLVELSASAAGAPAFAAVSPTNGETCATITNGACAGSSANLGGGFEKADFQVPTDLKIDPSGNIWYINIGPASSGTITQNSTTIVEVVGAATPVVTPLSVAAKLGKLGQKP